MCLPYLSHLSKYNPSSLLLSAQEVLPDILNCLMDHSSSGKWISHSFFCLVDTNMSYLWSVCFHTGLKPSIADNLPPLLWLKSFWKSYLPFKLHSNQTTHLLARCFDKSVLFGRFLQKAHFHCAYHPQPFG